MHLEFCLLPHGGHLLHHLFQKTLLLRRGGHSRDVLVEVRDLLLEELAKGDLRLALDLEANEPVDLVPVSVLQALISKVDYHGQHGAEVFDVVLWVFPGRRKGRGRRRRICSPLVAKTSLYELQQRKGS